MVGLGKLAMCPLTLWGQSGVHLAVSRVQFKKLNSQRLKNHPNGIHQGRNCPKSNTVDWVTFQQIVLTHYVGHLACSILLKLKKAKVCRQVAVMMMMVKSLELEGVHWILLSALLVRFPQVQGMLPSAAFCYFLSYQRRRTVCIRNWQNFFPFYVLNEDDGREAA